MWPYVYKAQPLLENELSQTTWLFWICNSETIKICQNQYAGFSNPFLQWILEKQTSFRAIYLLK